MKFFVGVTDNRWFEFLSARNPDEVNFWRPKSTFDFHAITPGEPFLFKLHSPLNYIVGGGFLVRHSVLPVSLAWKAFGEKNGVDSFEILRKRVVDLGHRTETDPFIGCTILAEPFFFPKEMWIKVPDDWKANIVVGKTYDNTAGEGVRVWQQVQERLLIKSGAYDRQYKVADRYGNEYLTRARLGQGAFRVLVTDAYTRRCAITGERTLPVLEAAHIKPFAEDGPNRICNGLLFRSDLHILFDRGYMTITPDYHVNVSRRIKEEFDNGRHYYALEGKKLEVLPENIIDQPSSEFIEWHNENRFLI
jgi:putative restriction endonuclease